MYTVNIYVYVFCFYSFSFVLHCFCCFLIKNITFSLNAVFCCFLVQIIYYPCFHFFFIFMFFLSWLFLFLIFHFCLLFSKKEKNLEDKIKNKLLDMDVFLCVCKICLVFNIKNTLLCSIHCSLLSSC